MKCSEFHELLSGYIDDELTARETKKLLGHLEECRDCTVALGELLQQKEKMCLLRTAYVAAEPTAEFSQRVMRAIEQAEPLREPGGLRLIFLHMSSWFGMSLRRPALGMSFLFVVGVAIGLLVGVTPLKPFQENKLMSVYELQSKQVSEEVPCSTEMDDDDETIAFDHFAYSSADTIVNTPCLLEYAAHTAGADNY
ncbi:MAG: zf-HC2 domain-containing protein [Deltaproteobacteria bacterium]|nr:zf-HC2 domain-containing protein [Deltaproteobacteria bacterium]